tara:strand:+ start:77 stop:478 length:402 start_codon:yes stop_codon:yes gene_type:complete
MANPLLVILDIKKMMKIAKKFNSENKITGCLLYYKHRFIQILEGEEEIIKELYAKIKQDKKHYNVNLLYINEISERIFPRWSMVYKELNDSQLEKLTDTRLFEDNLIRFSEITNKPTLATRLFWKKAVEIIEI